MSDRTPNHVVARLAELSAIGRHEHGIYRGLATPAEYAARALLASWARAGHFSISQNRVGNIFVRRPGRRAGAKPILVGSHLDTVQTGGAYDGAYGVVGALCALELLDARSVATEHPVEAVAWAGEEGSRFPLGCLGSSVFAGLWREYNALELVSDDGVTLSDALETSNGGLLPNVAIREDRDVAAYLELHVEQGPIMEAAGISLGIVTAIAGQRRLRARVVGVSGHAGTVPMSMRSDALCAASELILALEAAAREVGDSVATVGRAIVEPNGTNVVPGDVTFSLDLRSPDVSKLDIIEARLADAVARVTRERHVSVEIETLEQRPPTIMTAELRDAIGRAIASLGERTIDVPSGAGHDAMSLGRIVPTAMIFVPSIGGRSHVDEERTEPRDLELGVEALAASIVEVDRTIGQK